MYCEIFDTTPQAAAFHFLTSRYLPYSRATPPTAAKYPRPIFRKLRSAAPHCPATSTSAFPFHRAPNRTSAHFCKEPHHARLPPPAANCGTIREIDPALPNISPPATAIPPTPARSDLSIPNRTKRPKCHFPYATSRRRMGTSFPPAAVLPPNAKTTRPRLRA